MRALLRRVPWEVRIVNGVLQQVMSMLSAATMSVVNVIQTVHVVITTVVI